MAVEQRRRRFVRHYPSGEHLVHVAFRFKPEDSGNVGSIVVKFEQNSRTAGTSYFDNIRLAAVPEPSSLASLSLGISGLAIRLYSRRSKLNRAGRRDSSTAAPPLTMSPVERAVVFLSGQKYALST